MSGFFQHVCLDFFKAAESTSSAFPEPSFSDLFIKISIELLNICDCIIIIFISNKLVVGYEELLEYAVRNGASIDLLALEMAVRNNRLALVKFFFRFLPIIDSPSFPRKWSKKKQQRHCKARHYPAVTAFRLSRRRLKSLVLEAASNGFDEMMFFLWESLLLFPNSPKEKRRDDNEVKEMEEKEMEGTKGKSWRISLEDVAIARLAGPNRNIYLPVCSPSSPPGFFEKYYSQQNKASLLDRVSPQRRSNVILALSERATVADIQLLLPSPTADDMNCIGIGRVRCLVEDSPSR